MARLPLLETCDQDDPKQAFQWALVALPFHGSTPFTMEEGLREQWSERLWQAGFRHHPELQKVKFRPPYRGQQHTLNNSGGWVDIDEPDLDPVELPNMEAYTRHEQEVVAEQLRYHGVVQEQQPKVARAMVVQGPQFNPADHTVSKVNGYLLAPVPMEEKRRVIAAEMVGKKRQGILNAPQNKGI